MTRPPCLAELTTHLTGDTPAVVMASGDHMRALLAYIAELEDDRALLVAVAHLAIAAARPGYVPLTQVGALIDEVLERIE